MSETANSVQPAADQGGPREIDGGRFEEWSLADFAGQCRMQARDMLDPAYSEFMAELAKRLAALSASAPAAEWQAIATAPKDGTLLILACAGWPFDWKAVPVKMGGWDTCSEFWRVFGASWEPTHWQIAPTGPERTSPSPEHAA